MINKVAEFKDRLNEALEIRNLPPVELARKTHIRESTISQYRSGYAKPKEDKLTLISDALHINPAWLMGLDVPMEIPLMDNSIKLTEDEHRLIIECRNRYKENEDIYKHLLAYIKMLSEIKKDI